MITSTLFFIIVFLAGATRCYIKAFTEDDEFNGFVNFIVALFLSLCLAGSIEILIILLK